MTTTLTRDLCDVLGLDYENVSRVVITPANVDATVYLLNAQGSKHLTEDGEPAAELHRFEVTT